MPSKNEHTVRRACQIAEVTLNFEVEAVLQSGESGA
jgi:hypothetical protein